MNWTLSKLLRNQIFKTLPCVVVTHKRIVPGQTREIDMVLYEHNVSDGKIRI